MEGGSIVCAVSSVIAASFSCHFAGFYYRVPGITGDQWHCMSRQRDFTWKQVAIELMLQYVKRTQGSFIENKVCD